MFGEATKLYQANGFRILWETYTKVLKNTWSKYEGTAIISLKPVQQVSWNPQTKPRPLEQEPYAKKTTLSPKGRTPNPVVVTPATLHKSETCSLLLGHLET